MVWTCSSSPITPVSDTVKAPLLTEQEDAKRHRRGLAQTKDFLLRLSPSARIGGRKMRPPHFFEDECGTNRELIESSYGNKARKKENRQPKRGMGRGQGSGSPPARRAGFWKDDQGHRGTGVGSASRHEWGWAGFLSVTPASGGAPRYHPNPSTKRASCAPLRGARAAHTIKLLA